MNTIKGKILTKETQTGIPNLLVVIYDIDARTANEPAESFVDERTNPNPINLNYFWTKINGDRLGSVITDANGEFSLSYEDNEFMRDKKETRPDLILFVLAPEEEIASPPPLSHINISHGLGANVEETQAPKILYTSRFLRANAGKTESYVINLKEQQLADAGISTQKNEDNINKKKAAILKSFSDSKQLSDTLKKALDESTKENLQKATSIRKQVKSKIKHDILSTAKSEIKQSNNYLGKDDILAVKHEAVMIAGLGKLKNRKSNGKQPMLKIVESRQGKTPPTTYTEVCNLIIDNPRGSSIEPIIAAFPACKPKEYLPRDDEGGGEERTTTDNPPTVTAPVVTSVELFVRDRLTEIYSVTTPPNGPCIKLKKTPCEEDIQFDVKNFQLSTGPADTTAYHDFQVLKIAFENIWKEVFDEYTTERIRTLAEEYIKISGDRYSGLPHIDEVITNETIASRQELLAFLSFIESSTASLSSTINIPVAISVAVPYMTPSLFNNISGEDIAILEGIGNEILKIQNPPFMTIPSLDPEGEIEEKRKTAKLIIDKYPSPISRIQEILGQLTQRLTEPHKFDIFAPDSFNFGLLLTYRQTWVPGNFQVGDLVSTIPLAPKESRKYSKKITVKKSRQQKEAESSNSFRKSEMDSTSRVDSEIINKASNKTNFKASAEGGFDIGVGNAKASAGVETDSASESSQTKKDFREAVKKAAEEYKQERKLDVDVTSSSEFEETVSGEITNTNDEITVTYLFYELQRQYELSEKLHKLTPVIMVAREVPAPNEIDEDWITAHDWILKRVILDDSFLPAINYITSNLQGDDLALKVLKANLDMLTDVVKDLKTQIVDSTNLRDEALSLVRNDEESLSHHIYVDADGEKTQAAQMYLDQKKAAYDRAVNQIIDLHNKLSQNSLALQQAADKYNIALQNHLNKQSEILRLKVHIKNNILYYMQKIWDMEVPDQRFFALYNIEIPAFTVSSTSSTEYRRGGIEDPGAIYITIETDHSVDDTTKYKLHEIADLDTVLGYKGNYMIFPLKKNNHLTLHMMQEYIQIKDGNVGINDPDPFGNYTEQEFKDYVKCVYESVGEEVFNRDYKETFKEMYTNYITNARPDKETIVVPTNSLYIEALPGKHPLLEDFKLEHRKWDVKKVEEEVNRAKLENLRLATRLLKGESDDPDIDKKIVIEGGKDVVTPTE